MSAEGGALEWVKDHGYQMARCPDCGKLLEATRASGDIQCGFSALVEKRTPLGQELYQATCGHSATEGFCDRPHAYICMGCHWGIIIN